MSEESSSVPVRIVLRTVLTILLVWAMASFIPQYFSLSGGFVGVLVVGCLVTLLNLLVRPLLALVTLPFKLFAYFLAVVIVNGGIVWLIDFISQRFDASILSLTIGSGLVGWVVVAVILGMGNWLMKEMLK